MASSELVENLKQGFVKTSNAIKLIRVMVTGSSSGTLDALNTTTKASIIAAINEVNSKAVAVPDASESVKGIVTLASLSEMATGSNVTKVATVAGVRQERQALKEELLGGATPAFDTLKELADAVQAAEESDVITQLTTVVGQKANDADVWKKADIGDVTTDFVTIINNALA